MCNMNNTISYIYHLRIIGLLHSISYIIHSDRFEMKSGNSSKNCITDNFTDNIMTRTSTMTFSNQFEVADLSV